MTDLGHLEHSRRVDHDYVQCFGTNAFRPTCLSCYARGGSVVPFLRYLVFVGGALVALLFAANWVWPGAPSAPVQQASTETPVEHTIRIPSARRWPDKIDFD